MSTHRLPTSPTRRLMWRLAPLPLLAALACADGADPVAPPEPRSLTPESARAAAYPGTTNTEFSGVQVQGEAMALSIKFNYTGVVTPSFTVGTGPDVFATQVISVPAKKQAAGYWTATAGGLTAGKRYYYRLDNLKSTWYDSAKTLRRDVTFDLDSTYIHDDGDQGPGCGEMVIKPLIGPYDPANKYWWDFFLGEYCMHSGNMYRFADSQVKRTWTGFYANKAMLYFEVYELDVEGFCGSWSTTCGQRNDTINESNTFDVTKTGTHTFVQSTWWGRKPYLTLYGKLSVKYVAW
jgi:hypothetical protein